MTPRSTVDYDLARTIAFSDGVIAIAMTLLALELPVPRGATNAEVWQSFVDHLDDEYLSFLISFAVIATFWFSHHRCFRYLARLDRRIAVLNMVCLFAIVAIPFASRVVALNGSVALGPIFYAAVILLYGGTFVLLVRHAEQAALWREDVPPTFAPDMRWGLGAALAVFAISIPLALVVPTAAEYSWLLIPFVSIMVDRVRGTSRR